MKILESPGGLKIYQRGPLLQRPPLPALFYFATGGEETLTQDPFIQPLLPFQHKEIHLFSFDLPFHGRGLDNKAAIKKWVEELRKGHDPITPFLNQCKEAIQFLIDAEFVNPRAMGVAGLSRGAFIATHLAALESRIHSVLGFAPLTQWGVTDETQDLRENLVAQNLSLHRVIDQLRDKRLRFYIGNHDTLVSTPHCFNFIQALTHAHSLSTRSFPPVELFIVPSAGYRGHGTLPTTFEEGGHWLLKNLTPPLSK